jgi:hypothetical protein
MQTIRRNILDLSLNFPSIRLYAGDRNGQKRKKLKFDGNGQSKYRGPDPEDSETSSYSYHFNVAWFQRKKSG